MTRGGARLPVDMVTGVQQPALEERSEIAMRHAHVGYEKQKKTSGYENRLMMDPLIVNKRVMAPLSPMAWERVTLRTTLEIGFCGTVASCCLVYYKPLRGVVGFH